MNRLLEKKKKDRIVTKAKENISNSVPIIKGAQTIIDLLILYQYYHIVLGQTLVTSERAIPANINENNLYMNNCDK